MTSRLFAPYLVLPTDGMNQTVINDIFPVLLPKINIANKMPHPVIDVFSALGGTPDLECGSVHTQHHPLPLLTETGHTLVAIAVHTQHHPLPLLTETGYTLVAIACC